MNLNYELVFGADKVGHFLLFFLISFLLGMTVLVIIDKFYLFTSLRVIWLYLVMLGIIEEYRQFLVPERSTEFLDAVANMLGVSTGLLIPLLIATFLARKSRSTRQLFVFFIFFLIPLPFYIGLWEINQMPFFL